MASKSIASRLSFVPLLLTALTFCNQVYAKPSIEWQPEKIEIRQMEGSQGQYSAEVTFNTSAKDVTARVVPALEQWVTVSPISYGDVQQGTTLTIELIVSIPSEEVVGSYDGVLQLRSGKNQKNLAKPLQISLTVTPKSADGLPPDPGEAGKATLLGVDSDLDGVRDDIQRYIVLTYPDKPNLQMAMFQLSRTYQRMLDPELVDGTEKAIADQVGDDISCLHFTAGDATLGSNLFRRLKAEILNTKDRSVKYLGYDKKLSGKTFALSKLPRQERYKLCDFVVQ